MRNARADATPWARAAAAGGSCVPAAPHLLLFEGRSQAGGQLLGVCVVQGAGVQLALLLQASQGGVHTQG